MSKPLTLTLAGLTLTTAALVAGCDDNASGNAKAAASLEEAVAVYRTAEQGFAPQDYTGPYKAYRLERLNEARSKLEPIADRSVSGAAKADAHRLLASVDVTMARMHADRADAAFAMIRGQSTGLFNHLAAVERIGALMVARAGDGGSVAAALEEGQAMIRQSKAGLTSSISELTAQRETATLETQRFAGDATSQFETAQEFEQAAFTANGIEAKQGAYNQSYAAKVAGENAQLQSQRAQIQVDSFSERLAPQQTELELWNKMSTQISELQARVTQDNADASKDIELAKTARTSAIAAVDEQYQSLAAMFEEDVMKPLDAAIASATSAISHAENAASLNKGGDRATLQLEKTAAQVALVHAIARQAGYAKAFAQTISAMVANPSLAGAPVLDGYRAKQQELMQKATQLADQAKAAIAAGLEANPVATDGSANPNDPAVALNQTLQAYGSQLN